MEEIYEGNGLKLGYSLILLLVSYLFLPSGIAIDKERVQKAASIIEYSKKRFP